MVIEQNWKKHSYLFIDLIDQIGPKFIHLLIQTK